MPLDVRLADPFVFDDVAVDVAGVVYSVLRSVGCGLRYRVAVDVENAGDGVGTQ